MGSYNPDGFAWSGRLQALLTVAVAGPVMLAVYFVLLRLFRVTELGDMLRPLLGRLGRGGQAPAAGTGDAPSSAPAAGSSGSRPERATTSVDTGLIPRISGEFDAVSFRAGPDPERGVRRQDLPDDGSQQAPVAEYLPGEEQPATARGGMLSEQIPLPGRRTYQGKAGENPYFKNRRPRKK
jgi:putative peptidoglycan lipid II flippase